MEALKETKQPLSVAVLAEKAGAVGQEETVYQIVRHLEANRRGITLTGDRTRLDRLTIAAS